MTVMLRSFFALLFLSAHLSHTLFASSVFPYSLRPRQNQEPIKKNNKVRRITPPSPSSPLSLSTSGWLVLLIYLDSAHILHLAISVSAELTPELFSKDKTRKVEDKTRKALCEKELGFSRFVFLSFPKVSA